jgi:uncharacterized membrane protein YhaH (DUF805 family)
MMELCARTSRARPRGSDVVNLPEAIKSCFRQYARFSGRARRSEYWFWVLFTFLASLVASLLDNVLGTAYQTQYGSSGGLVQGLVGLVTLVPSLAVFWRRMHDTGRSGAWAFCLLIPLANIVFGIVFIVWAAKDSQPVENKYGPNPKGIGGGYGQFPGCPY